MILDAVDLSPKFFWKPHGIILWSNLPHPFIDENNPGTKQKLLRPVTLSLQYFSLAANCITASSTSNTASTFFRNTSPRTYGPVPPSPTVVMHIPVRGFSASRRSRSLGLSQKGCPSMTTATRGGMASQVV